MNLTPIRGFRAGAVATVAVLLAYTALEWASFIHEFKGVPITPWNPGLGVVFGLMVVAGPIAGLLLFAGTIAAEAIVLRTDLDWPLVVGIAAVTSLSYAAIAVLARRVLRLDASLAHLQDILALLVCGISGALANSILLTSLLVVAGPLDPRDFWSAVVPLLVGDGIGIAVVTPLVLRFVFHHHALSRQQVVALAPEATLLVSLIAAALLLVGGLGAGGQKAFYLLFVPVVAAALRRGLDGACLGLTATQFALVGLLQVHDYDAQEFTEFQVLMLVLTATGLIVGVVVDERRNADQHAREAEARLKRKEAEVSQSARFNLVTGMASALAHEITQPMTAARALARSVQHILESSDGDVARAKANLATLIAQIDHAGHVLHHVRDFLRRGTPHQSTLDIGAIADDAISLLRSDAATRRVAIELDIPDELPPLYGDQVQLLQVLLNLVHNAMEAIGPGGGGRIRIAARHLDAPARVEFSVVDNGPGVAPDIAGALFDPLITSKADNLGLGLSICASIIEAHGGTIWLQSSAPGRTEFRFSLPLEPSSTDSHAPADNLRDR